MKSFGISLIFLFLTASVVLVNAFFVADRLGDIEDSIAGLPVVYSEEELPGLLAEVRGIVRRWDSVLPFLSLSIQSEPLRDCSVSLHNLEAYCLSGSVADYNSARSDCAVRLGFLRRHESLAPSNILRANNAQFTIHNAQLMGNWGVVLSGTTSTSP